MNKQDVLKWVQDTYGVEPESPWAKYPEDMVLRHLNNKKWFGLLMTVNAGVLGLDRDEQVDILNVKCEPLEIDFLSQQPGFFHGYHMNKNHWLTILLDGTVPMETVCGLIERSLDLTAPKIKKKK